APPRLDLRPIARQIIASGVSPPIPAGLGIDRGGRDLRVEQHQPVGIGPSGKAGLLDKDFANLFAMLFATREDDVRPATVARAAIGWHIDNTTAAETVARQVS